MTYTNYRGTDIVGEIGDASEVARLLAEGKMLQSYVSYKTCVRWILDGAFPTADIWYTERNGDPIGMLVPKDTPEAKLPDQAKSYLVIRWEHPAANLSGEQVINLIRKLIDED